MLRSDILLACKPRPINRSRSDTTPRFGARAPALNSIGQSLYEGMHFLAALLAPDVVAPKLFSWMLRRHTRVPEVRECSAQASTTLRFFWRARKAMNFR